MSQISNALATVDNGPGALVQKYRDEYAAVMPSHVKPDTWVRLAVGVLRENEKLAEAASSNPGSFLNALKTAARLGLEPGTEQFYLRPIKRKGVPEVQGIVGYQGIVELIYRAGHASSVTVEVVRANDVFVWRPGALDTQQPPRWQGPQQQPFHDANWFGDRGDLVGVYAYAVMKDGAISKVVVLNRDHIARAKAKSDGADGQYSPWRTDEEAMWLKTAARRLGKWVPTSAEIRSPGTDPHAPVPLAAPAAAPLDELDPDDEGPLEGELVD
ncbi:recombinase RecT [Streptomyces mexicanus]|uniref:recombinase RecT n=1 Tax=Streptomyces mexicanus TaxID=178566 RepID=UPI0036646F2F